MFLYSNCNLTLANAFRLLLHLKVSGTLFIYLFIIIIVIIIIIIIIVYENSRRYLSNLIS